MLTESEVLSIEKLTSHTERNPIGLGKRNVTCKVYIEVQDVKIIYTIEEHIIFGKYKHMSFLPNDFKKHIPALLIVSILNKAGFDTTDTAIEKCSISSISSCIHILQSELGVSLRSIELPEGYTLYTGIHDQEKCQILH